MAKDLFEGMSQEPRDLFAETEVQQPQGAWSEVYKKYLSEAQHRASRASIPGAEEYDKTPPMSFDAFSKMKDKEYRDKLIAIPETALHMGLGMGSAVVGGLVAPLAPIMPWAHTRDPQKMFEDISALPAGIPKLSDTTDDYLRSVGSVMQAFPVTGTYPGLLRPVRAGQAATPAVAANLKALAEAKKKPVETGPMPTEAPLPDTLANRVKAREQQAMTPSQLKEWKDTQDKFAAYQKEQEQLTRANQAQEAINARQAALEQDVATQTNQDFNAAERVRQEQAPTGYADWVEQQRQSANERQPGNNAPMEFESPYPADAQHYPDILQDAPYQHDNFIDPDTAGTKALPITVADMLNTGEKSVDPFQRTNTSRTVARNILETDLHPPIIKTVDARRGGKQSGAVDPEVFKAGFRNINRALSNLTDQPWVKESFPSHSFETNSDGTPKILLHGTREAFNDQPRGVSYEGLHAGYGGAATLKAATSSRDGRVGYRDRNLSYDYNGTKEGKSAIYPIALRKGNYPRLAGDYGSWEPLKLADSRQFKLDFAKAVDRGFFEVDDFMENYKERLKNQDMSPQEENLIFSRMLKEAFDVDGFFYPNKYETPQQQIMSKSGLMKSPQRARNYASKLGLEDSVVTYDDNNMVSLYDQSTQNPQMNSGMARGQRGGFDYEILPKAFRDFVDSWKAAGGNLSHVGVSRMLDDHPVKLTKETRGLLASLYPETAKKYQARIDKAWLQSDPDKAARWGKNYDDALITEAVLKQHDAFGKGFTLDGPRYDAKTGRYAGKVAAQEQADAVINSAKRNQRGALDWGDSKTNDFLKKLNPFSRENRFTKIQQQTKTLAENFQESFPVASKWLQQRSVQELINDMVDADKTDNPIQYWQEKLAGVSAADDPTIGGQMKPIGRNTSYGQARGPRDMMQIVLSPEEQAAALEMAQTIKYLRDEFTVSKRTVLEPAQVNPDSFTWPSGKDPMWHDERMKNAQYKAAYEKQGVEIARWNRETQRLNEQFADEYGFSPAHFDDMSLEYGSPEDHVWGVIFGVADKIKHDEDRAITAHGLQGFSGMGKNQRGAIDFGAFNKDKQKLIEEATKSKLWAQEITGQQVVDEAIAHGKDAKGATNFSAGGSLEAEKRASPLVRGGVRILQRFKNQSENAVRESVFPTETALRKLSRNELADLGEAFKQEMFLRERFSMEELAQAGLNEKQLLAYKRTRDMFTDALEAQNKVREIQGLKRISENEVYLSSRWQGDFRMPFHDEKGRLKWYLAADSKRSLEKQASELMSRFPGELTPGEMSVVKSSKKGVDAQSIYTQMLDVLGRDDPAVAKIAKWVEESTVEQGRKTLGQEKHFEPKANVQGFIGDRPWNNPKQEAIDMFQQQINYAKNAHNWSGLQLAGQELKHIFANEDLAKTQPHALNYLKEYYADNLGFNEHKVIKAFEDFVRDDHTFMGMTIKGVSPNMLGRGIGNLKAVWVLQKLAVNTGFAISNVIQASNMLPHLADLTIKEGGNPLTGLALGIPTGLAMAAGHATQQPGKFHKALGAIPGYDVFTARAMKYAEDNSVIARSIYDESPIESSFSATGQGAKYLGKTITSPETILRSVVYMTYVNALKGSKKFKNDVDIFRLAEEKTNISMGDYREGERAMIFNKMGNLGNALNTLQTYPMNFYNQWIWAGKETMRGNPVPAMVMLGAQTYMAGAMGIPGFAEADKLLEFIKDHLAQSAPTYWNKVKNFSLKKIMLDVSPDMLYGGASGRTGIALTARAAAPIPSEMVQTPGAPAMDLLQQGASVAQAVADPMDKQKVAQAVLNTAPTGLQGALETGPLRDQTSVQTGDTRTYGKIKDLSAMEGQVKRTPADERLRAWGLRSQREVAERDQTYATQKHIAQATQITRDLPGKIYNKLATNQLDDAKEYIELYTELSGKAPTRQQLETQIIARFTTPGQRLNMKKTMPLETVLAVKRLHETLDRMGYAE